MSEEQKRIEELENRLVAINSIIFAAGAPLGSDNYFAIREHTAKTLREVDAKQNATGTPNQS